MLVLSKPYGHPHLRVISRLIIFPTLSILSSNYDHLLMLVHYQKSIKDVKRCFIYGLQVHAVDATTATVNRRVTVELACNYDSGILPMKKYVVANIFFSLRENPPYSFRRLYYIM